MNKLLIITAIFFSFMYSAQSFARLSANNTGWAPVDMYAETRIKNLKVLFLEVQGSQGLQMDRWSITFRVNGPITNGIKNFPPQKLKYQFSYLTYIGAGNGTPPSASNMSLNTLQLPFQIAKSYFVQQSNYNLGINDYFSINLNYDVIIEGGAYLEEYSSWNNFKVNMIMELRNSIGGLMSQVPVDFDLRIMPLGTPPQTPSYGMSFDASAKNVLLEFNTANDYANGLSKTQSRAFSTFSKTGYVVRVNTLNSNLVSISDKTLPVSAVRLMVIDNQSKAVTGNVTLSTAQQKVISSVAHTATKFFDTTYSTQPGDPTFFNKSPEQYSGTLVYTMIPQ